MSDAYDRRMVVVSMALLVSDHQFSLLPTLVFHRRHIALHHVDGHVSHVSKDGRLQTAVAASLYLVEVVRWFVSNATASLLGLHICSR